jgi:hypothetical protein
MDDEIDNMIDEMNKFNITDSYTIQDRKRQILQKLVLEKEEMKHYQKLLLDYRYVDELDELRIGSYLRFFRLTSNTLDLRSGGFLADIQLKNENIVLLLKNRNRFFNLKLNECILFQKNTTQEKILIQILDQIKR